MSDQDFSRLSHNGQNQGNDHFSTLTRSQQKNIERRGHRALYDFPPKLIKRIANIAEEFGLTNSQVAGILILHALKDFKTSKINLRDFRLNSESPRYDYKIDLDKWIDEWDI